MVQQRAAIAQTRDAVEAKFPSKGLKLRKDAIPSAPDGNVINLHIIQPEITDRATCIVYIHGGGMMANSCFDGTYRAWGKLLAAKGLVVVMVDFRNSIVPSSVPEVAPYPAGLNDCVSGLKWTHANADALNIDPRRIIVAGESGGANLALAAAMKLKRDGLADLVAGVYCMCPMIGGEYPNPRFPSSFKSDGVTTTNEDLRRNAVGYGLEHARDPLAWPLHASAADLADLPPVVVSVNECDPLREEGAAMHAALLAAGVAARLRVALGTCHAAEFLLSMTLDFAAATVADMAAFATAPDMAAFAAQAPAAAAAPA